MKNIVKWLFVMGVLISAIPALFGADIIVDSYTKAGLPAAGTAGRICRVTDDVRGLWTDNGTKWVKVVPYVMASDFGFSPQDTAANNTTAINAALAAARNSEAYKTVKMPPGVFDVNGFTFPGTGPISTDYPSQNIGLIGAGNGYTINAPTTNGPATILKFASGMTSGLGSPATYGIYLDSSRNGAYAVLEDFQIDGNSAVDYGLRVVSTITVSRVTAARCNVAGFRGQTMDSTRLNQIVAVENGQHGMLIDKATAQDSGNYSNNTATIIYGSLFEANTGKGLTITQLVGGQILSSVIQGNGSYGLYLYQYTAIPGPSFLEFDQVWFENNGGAVDLYQIMIDSQNPTDPSNVPDDLLFRNCWVDPLSSRKSMNISAGIRIEFTDTMWRVDPTGTIDLGANAKQIFFRKRKSVGGTVNNSGTNNFDLDTLSDRPGLGVTGYGSSPAFLSADGGFIGGTLVIGNGTSITKHLSATKTWDPPSVSNGSATSTTVTVTGATVGDTVAVGFSTAVPGRALLVGAVTAADTVTVTLANHTGGALNLASGTLRADVWKH